jgi:hypothetical protein
MFLFLQELSTIVGFAIVVFTYCLWLRRHPVSPSGQSGSDGWRYLFWLAILGPSFLISLPAAAGYATSASLHDVRFVRSILFRTALYSSAIAVPLGLAATSIIYARRDYELLQSFPDFDSIPAAVDGQIYLVNASAYFARPGPRIVDSLEILAAILHPREFPEFASRGPKDPRVVRVGCRPLGCTRRARSFAGGVGARRRRARSPRPAGCC